MPPSPAARALRRLVPAALRRRGRRAMFGWLDLAWTTPSGIGLRVANYNEWIIYNEIFVDGEYDAAIAAAIAGREAGRTMRVLDLGANVGFFTLRLFDRLRTAGLPDACCAATLVEANPELVPVLRARIHVDNPLIDCTDVVPGAAGEPSGTATLHASFEAPGDGSVVRRTTAAGVTVPYVDLTRLCGNAPVDLLKCDIEGSERTLIERYPQLLQRTRVAVFELHHDLADVARCRDGLRAAGLTEETVLRDRGGCSLRLFRNLNP